MKKRLSIIVTGLAVVFILTAVCIPHHHHGEMMYLAQELCGGQDNGDEHEENSTTDDHTQHYLPSTDVKLDAAAHADGLQQWLTPFLPTCIAGYQLTCPMPAVTTRCASLYYFKHKQYLSWQQRCRGLRAPPCC